MIYLCGMQGQDRPPNLAGVNDSVSYIKAELVKQLGMRNVYQLTFPTSFKKLVLDLFYSSPGNSTSPNFGTINPVILSNIGDMFGHQYSITYDTEAGVSSYFWYPKTSAYEFDIIDGYSPCTIQYMLNMNALLAQQTNMYCVANILEIGGVPLETYHNMYWRR